MSGSEVKDSMCLHTAGLDPLFVLPRSPGELSSEEEVLGPPGAVGSYLMDAAPRRLVLVSASPGCFRWVPQMCVAKNPAG